MTTEIKVIDLSRDSTKYNITHVVGGLFIIALLLLIVQLFHINTEFYKRQQLRHTKHNQYNTTSGIYTGGSLGLKGVGNDVLVDTERGVVKLDYTNHAEKDKLLKELHEIMTQLKAVGNIKVDNEEINYEIKKSIKNLQKVITASKDVQTVSGYAGNNTSPVNLEEGLCTMDLQHSIIEQAMIDSVNPNEFVYSKNYNTVLENNEDDSISSNNAEDVIMYLVRHLDITIRFLRNDVCRGGKLDLTQLYKILYKLNQHLGKKGKYGVIDINELITNTSESGNYGMYFPAKIAGESQSNVPLFLKETSNIEPFRGGRCSMNSMFSHGSDGVSDGVSNDLLSESAFAHGSRLPKSRIDLSGSRETQVREMPVKVPRNSSLSSLPSQAGSPSLAGSPSQADRYGEFSKFNVMVRNKFGSLGYSMCCADGAAGCKCAAGCRCGGCSKCGAVFADFINNYAKKHPRKVIPPDYTALNNSMLKKNKNAYSDNLGHLSFYKNPIVGMPYIGDNTVEGIAERDIMQHETPGSILSTVRDNTHYYAVRDGACGGTTPSDSDFFKECTSKDLTLESALDGSPEKMLACVGECDREPNYMNYYSQIAEASAGADTYGADFEIPKVKPNKKNYNI